jgi:hypothetical protein
MKELHEVVVRFVRSETDAAKILGNLRKCLETRSEPLSAVDVRHADSIGPEGLSPDDGAVRCRVECFGDPVADRFGKREEDDRCEEERQKKDAYAPEREEHEKDEERDPGDAGEGEEERER